MGSSEISHVPTFESFMTISEDEKLSSSVIDKSAFSFNVMGCITTQIQNTNKPSFP